MKIEVGMYMRTNDGKICKITKFTYPDVRLTHLKGTVYTDNGIYWGMDILKTSHNIIDLIEVGDVIAIKEDIDKFSQVFILGIYEPALLKEIKARVESHKLIIDRIVTKEQFEQVSYKVGE